MKVEHFAINVADPAAVAAWYRDHLGMHILRAGPAPTFTHFIADDAGLQVEFYNDERGAYFEGAGSSVYTWHLAFTADDMTAEHARLVAAGCKAEGSINTTPVGDQLAFLRDPWGLALQLVKRAAP